MAYELELSNVSARACTLYGYPGVSALAAGGTQLGKAAGRSAADPERVVTLAPGATAHVLLTVADTAVYPSSACRAKTALSLKVYPPNDSGARHAFFSLPVCTDKTVDLTIWRVQPGL